MGEACLQNFMAPLRSRIDEVLSAGLAHMRLAPTGTRAEKRNAPLDWGEVAAALNVAGEAKRTRDKEEQEREQELLEDLRSVGVRELTREVNKHVARLTPADKAGLDKRLADAADHYTIDPLEAWKLLGVDKDDDDEPPSVQLTEEELWQAFIMQSDLANQLYADETLVPHDERKAPRVTRREFNEIRNRELSKWVHDNPGEKLTNRHRLVKYLMTELPVYGVEAPSWDSIREKWKKLEKERAREEARSRGSRA